MPGRKKSLIREAYDKHISERAVSYQRVVNVVERRTAVTTPEHEYDREFEYETSRYSRIQSYHDNDQRGYHSDSIHLGNDRGYHGHSTAIGSIRGRNSPNPRQEDYRDSYYRAFRDDVPVGLQGERRDSSGTGLPPTHRGQDLAPLMRTLSSAHLDRIDPKLIQALILLGRGKDSEDFLRRDLGSYPTGTARDPYATVRDRSPVRRDNPPGPLPRRGTPPAPISRRGTLPAPIPRRGTPPAPIPRRDGPPGPVLWRDTPPGPVPRRDTPPGPALRRDTPPGPAPRRDTPPGPAPRRDTPPGPAPRRDTPPGPAPRRDTPPGPAPRRDTPPGPAPRRDTPPGPAPRRDTPPGPAPRRDTPPGPAPRRDTPPGPAPRRDTPPGPAPRRDTPPGPAPRRDTPPGPAPRRDTPPGPAPRRDTPPGPVPRRDTPPGPVPRRDTPPGPVPRRDTPPGPVPRRDTPPGPVLMHSGLNTSRRSYSSDRDQNSFSYQQSQQRKYNEELVTLSREPDASLLLGHGVSLDGSPHSCTATKEECTPAPSLSTGPDEMVTVKEPEQAEDSNFKTRRSQAIAAKALEIEKLYKQDCETFGTVVKMLVVKEPSLEKLLQNPLKDNLIEIRERCLNDLRHFIIELDQVTNKA
ncbi:serine/arginine repetitive matrix protein 1 isoform X2 [Esox lucius]|uniref:serine/arginine repetitive matrix protein 1 isoform X2 n=1 Tax=Esox lucius TaxID=8010 RepID=UPI001476C550|nr:serine/arginine repetitive matrix protein 1 isoform X2 [Esox lucius]